jgi:hypothetical protein
MLQVDSLRQLDNDLVECLVLTPMGERIVGYPCLEDHLDALVEARLGLDGVVDAIAASLPAAALRTAAPPTAE